MGLVKYSAAVAAISGKVGGAVYARNKAGAIIRAWAKPVSAPTQSQSLARANFGNQSAKWGALTKDQRTAYVDAAATLTRINRLGEPYVPSGRQIFIESSSNLAQADLPAFSVVPPNFTAPSVSVAQDVEYGIGGGGFSSMALIGNAVDANTKIIVFATRPITTSKTNTKNDLRQIGVFTLGATINIVAEYIALFGNDATVDSQIDFGLKTLNVANGMTSSLLLKTGILV